jgi:hypothetical protein
LSLGSQDTRQPVYKGELYRQRVGAAISENVSPGRKGLRPPLVALRETQFAETIPREMCKSVNSNHSNQTAVATLGCMCPVYVEKVRTETPTASDIGYGCQRDRLQLEDRTFSIQEDKVISLFISEIGRLYKQRAGEEVRSKHAH